MNSDLSASAESSAGPLLDSVTPLYVAVATAQEASGREAVLRIVTSKDAINARAGALYSVKKFFTESRDLGKRVHRVAGHFLLGKRLDRATEVLHASTTTPYTIDTSRDPPIPHNAT